MQRNSPGAARGGPVVLRPVRATTCLFLSMLAVLAAMMYSKQMQTLKPRPYQQQCRSNIVECYKLNDSFDMSNAASTLLPFWQKCCRFRQQCRTKFRPLDKVETNWTCSVCFDFVEMTKFDNREGWVDLGGWLHTEIKCRLRESNPDTVTHPSTNRVQRRLTSLI